MEHVDGVLGRTKASQPEKFQWAERVEECKAEELLWYWPGKSAAAQRDHLRLMAFGIKQLLIQVQT